MANKIQELKELCARVGKTNILLEREIRSKINDISLSINAQAELLRKAEEKCVTCLKLKSASYEIEGLTNKHLKLSKIIKRGNNIEYFDVKETLYLADDIDSFIKDLVEESKFKDIENPYWCTRDTLCEVDMPCLQGMECTSKKEGE